MQGKQIEIDGVTFNLDDPDEKRAAVRAWLKAKSKERREQEQSDTATVDTTPPSQGDAETDSLSEEG